MSNRDDLLTKWRTKLAEGSNDSCMHSAALRPDSFCTVFSMCWGGPGTCMFSALAPQNFDTPGDFVAFVRIVELPRSLALMCRDRDDSHTIAEDYLELVDAESRPLLEKAIVVADAALAKDVVAQADAEAVISAFNALFGRRGDAQSVAAGDITAVFPAERVQRRFCAWDDNPGELTEEDLAEPQTVVKRLLDSGEFDPVDAEHLSVARAALADFPMD